MSAPHLQVNRVLIVGEHRDAVPLELDGLELSEQDVNNLDLDAIAGNLASAGGYYTSVIRCGGISAARNAIEEIVAKKGKIDVLDILDHGAPGGIALGRDVAFHVDEVKLLRGSDLIHWLSGQLAETGQLRLLGCYTATGARGQRLLRLLGDRLKEDQIAFGTIMRIEEMHFSHEEGFLLRREALFSSISAMDGIAVTAKVRIKSLIAWQAEQQQLEDR